MRGNCQCNLDGPSPSPSHSQIFKVLRIVPPSLPRAGCTGRQLSLHKNGLTGSFPDLAGMTQLNYLQVWCASATRSMPVFQVAQIICVPGPCQWSLPVYWHWQWHGQFEAIRHTGVHLYRMGVFSPASAAEVREVCATRTCVTCRSNRLTGSLPASVGQLSNLLQLDFSNSAFCDSSTRAAVTH